jgi:hypothetical protein
MAALNMRPYLRRRLSMSTNPNAKRSRQGTSDPESGGRIMSLQIMQPRLRLALAGTPGDSMDTIVPPPRVLVPYTRAESARLV